jgi:ABC-type phosphate/phosphonate transport system substrate-binding protein
MWKKEFFLTATMLIFGVVPTLQAAQPLIFSTAPTHSTQKTLEIYQPIVDYLSEVTGREIVINTATTFIDYNNNLQKDNYNIIFDGPHFVGWRMDKFGHVPVARLPGYIRIVIVVKKSSNINSMEQLTGQRICSFPSPNMLTMAFFEYFQNPIRQPVPVPARGFKGLEKCLQRDDVVGAVLRDKMWAKMKNKENFKILLAPEKSYPERTFTLSSGIDAATRKKITYALLSKQGQEYLQGLLTTFKRDRLVPARPDEYKDLGLLLAPVWGFYN